MICARAAEAAPGATRSAHRTAYWAFLPSPSRKISGTTFLLRATADERWFHNLRWTNPACSSLVKELRLAGISTIEAANAFLPSFVANYNGRFAKHPARDKDLHRLLDPRQDILCWREQRQGHTNWW